MKSFPLYRLFFLLVCMTVVPCVQAAVVPMSLSNATDVPVTAAGYTATGNSVDLSLNFAPPTGATLTLIRNTGLSFIEGTFSNLAQGQEVALAFGGRTYAFVANYYGGTGNDLVLQWRHMRLMGWGDNWYGKVGDGTTYWRPVPVLIDTNTVLRHKTVLSAAVGVGHSLALCSDGTLAAWGYNGVGQLGNNSTTVDAKMVAVTMDGVLAGKRVVAVAVGGSHSLALCSDGTVAAWGGNHFGQLGNNSTTNSSVPVAVTVNGLLAGKTVIAISAGDDFSLAWCSDGTLATWGSNAVGQLGDGGGNDSLVPVAVALPTVLADKTVITIAAGNQHTLLLCSDSTLVGWGSNSSGQLGSDLPVKCYTPGVIIPTGALAGKTLLAVSAGAAHNLGLCSDGKVVAWGANANGQLGNDRTTPSAVPVAVNTAYVLTSRQATQVVAGGNTSFALCSDGTLTSWGDGYSAQLGNADYYYRNVLYPVPVSRSALAPDDRFVAVAPNSGASHCFAFVGTQAAAIEVRGNDIPILSQDLLPGPADGTDFGSTALFGAQVTRTFTITNTGASPLELPSLPAISGEAAADFQIVSSPISSPLAVGGSVDFAITFDPSGPGPRAATVTIANNDPLAPAFAYSITGSGVMPAKLAQTITFAPPPVINGTGDVLLTAVSSSGLPVKITLLSGPASLFFETEEGTTIRIDNTGVVKVQATVPASDKYAAVPPVIRTITIRNNPPVMTLLGLNQIYDGYSKGVGVLGPDGFIFATITYKVGGVWVSDGPIAPGSYPVKATELGKTVTGTLVIAKAPLYVTPDDKHKYAGQANPEFTVKYSGFVRDDTVAVITKAPVLRTTATAASIGGTYPITASGGAAANYTLVYRPGILVVDSFAGAYEALLVDANQVPVGKLTITVAATSKTFTAKLVTATDLTAPAFTGPLDFIGRLVNGSGMALTTAQVIGTATTNVTINKIVTPFVISFTLPEYGRVLASATRGGVPLGGSNTGQKLSTKPVLFAGAHTAVLEPATPAATNMPKGAGWATVKAGTTGILTFAGKLGDGTAFTATLSPGTLPPIGLGVLLEGDPGYRLFVQPYLAARTQSFLAGEFTLARHPTLDNRRHLAQQSMTWQKTGRPADVSYRAGFGPVSTVLMIDPWLPPVAATRTEPAILLAQRLGLAIPGTSFGVAHGATGSASQTSLPTRLGLSTANAVSVLAPVTVPVNKTKWKTLSFVPATGTFTGSFELVDGTIKRPVTFSGVLRQTIDTTDPLIGDGHYLMPPMTGTEKSTGEIMFTKP